MIRFMPDTAWDLLWRPLDMVSPESGLYVEFMAPDVRLLVALALGAVALAALLWRRPLNRSTAWLLGLTVLAYVSWMLTSGNGRYFLPFLILLGPLCIALIRALPASRAFQACMVIVLVMVQGYLMYLRPPWRYMTWLPWRDAPYFSLQVPGGPDEVTYVMAELHPYSLVTPQFPPGSRWVRLPNPAGPREHVLVQRFLRASHELRLMVPADLTNARADRQPSQQHLDLLGALMKPHGLVLRPDARCEFLASADLARTLSRDDEDAEILSRGGFWVCPLRFDPEAAVQPPLAVPAGDARTQSVLDAAERLCPRFFPHDEAITQQVGTAFVRHYPGTDTRLYLLQSDTVAYRFWTSLNPTVIGTSDQVMKGQVTLACNHIRSSNWRSGGP